MKSKKAKSKSLSKSDLRLNFISTINYHHDAFELVMIIKPMGLLKVDLLTSWHYITNQKSLKKTILLVKTFLIHNSKTKICSDKHFLQNATQEYV